MRELMVAHMVPPFHQMSPDMVRPAHYLYRQLWLNGLPTCRSIYRDHRFCLYEVLFLLGLPVQKFLNRKMWCTEATELFH